MATSAALVFAGKSVAAPAISFLINKAFSYLSEHGKAEGMDEVKNRLLLTMPKIQAVFDVVNPERIREQSSALDAWLWQLRDAVEEAEDAIDELEYYELEKKAKERKVSDWGSSFAKMKQKVVKSVKHVSILDNTVKKFTNRGTLKNLMKAVDDLDRAAAGVVGFLTLTDHLKGATSSSQQQLQLVDNDRQTGSMLSTSKFIGREKEKKHIIGWLTKTSIEKDEIGTSTNGVPIFSVVGHGGMGKTTLVQSICEEDEVWQNFKVIWVTVSTSLDATSLISKILECATGDKPTASQLEPLQQDLKEKLASVSFLLVLDDVWEDKRTNEWEKLFAPLRKVSTGSKILLTTRMRSVANLATRTMGVERDQFLTLQGLEEDENIKLFNHHVFSGLNPQDYVHLKVIGDQIAKKLGGCPLVTKVVSGHLQGNITLEYWSRFLDEGLEHFKGTEKDITSVLRLSYYHLPTELQICFRYCCIFPQDYEFRKKELVQMWIGSGLIPHSISDSITPEDTGEQFLTQLTTKSFFDLKPSVYIRKQENYVMHDLMHELARNVSFGECARITDSVRFEDVGDTIRHLCVANIHIYSVHEVNKISRFKSLRTLVVDNYHMVDKDVSCALEKVVESSKSLRLFHSRLRNTLHFGDKFAKLKHLRYIWMQQISPEAIHGIVKLYHLMLLHCLNGLKRETKQVRYLGNLERLRYVSYGSDGLGYFPISSLTSLQELNNYWVEGSTGNTISAIGSLRSLRMLEVCGLENVENHEEAISAKLNEKQHLHSLSLICSSYNCARDGANNLVLDHLEPHGNIRELQISFYEGHRFPFWMENLCVRNLVSLKLKGCINWEHLPSLAELVLLKHLELDGLPKLQQIGQSPHMSSSSYMELLLPASLDTLVVSSCRELRELPTLPSSLVSLHIEDVGVTKLPMIGKISSESVETKPSHLLHVSVTNCQCLVSLEGTLLEQKLHIGALRTLKITDCLHLESVSIPFEEMNGLRELCIRNCPKLRMMRDAKDELLPSSVTSLTMQQCGDLELPLLRSLQSLTNLSMLLLQNCSSLVSLPSVKVFNNSLKSLRSVSITGCGNLSSLGGLGSLSFLEQLRISACDKLTESPNPDAFDGEEEHLLEAGSSLQIQWLQIDLPSLLVVEPLTSLFHTRRLDIQNGTEMESLPERWLLQNCSALEHLLINQAKSLESLPPSLRNLSSLVDLSLFSAWRLRSLPYLPSSLQNLSVFYPCNSELEKKCVEYGGPEWSNISHIPKVQIGHSHLIKGKECSKETFERLRYSDDKVLTSWANQQKDDKRVVSSLPWWKKC